VSEISPINAIVAILGRHSLLDPEEAGKLASAIVEEMDLTIETSTPKGLEYLSSPSIFRWVSSWRRT
jgi:hypothetical protein